MATPSREAAVFFEPRLVAHAPEAAPPRFGRPPDGRGLSPPHCMRGTAGQKKIPETALRDPLVIEPARVDRPVLADRLRAHKGDILFHKHRFDVFTNENVPA